MYGLCITPKFVNNQEKTMDSFVNYKMNKRLSDLRPGQKGIIRKFNNDEASLKFMEMGCLPGEEVLLEQIAPLGDPISIIISGYTLSLRLEEAEQILIDINI